MAGSAHAASHINSTSSTNSASDSIYTICVDIGVRLTRSGGREATGSRASPARTNPKAASEAEGATSEDDTAVRATTRSSHGRTRERERRSSRCHLANVRAATTTLTSGISVKAGCSAKPVADGRCQAIGAGILGCLSSRIQNGGTSSITDAEQPSTAEAAEQMFACASRQAPSACSCAAATHQKARRQSTQRHGSGLRPLASV